MTINTIIYKAKTEVMMYSNNQELNSKKNCNVTSYYNNQEKRNIPDLMSSPTCPLD